MDEEKPDAIVPAAAGAHAVVIYVLTDGIHKRPDAADIFIEMPAIVAWRVYDEFAAPVFVETPASNGTMFFPDHDGKLRIPEETVLSGPEEAVARVLADAQAKWDRKQTK